MDFRAIREKIEQVRANCMSAASAIILTEFNFFPFQFFPFNMYIIRWAPPGLLTGDSVNAHLYQFNTSLNCTSAIRE